MRILHVGKINRPHITPWQIRKAQAMTRNRRHRVSRTGSVKVSNEPKGVGHIIFGWLILAMVVALMVILTHWWVPVIIFGFLALVGHRSTKAAERAATAKKERKHA